MWSGLIKDQYLSGLTADARSISRWMRAECMNSRYAHDTPLPVSRLEFLNQYILLSRKSFLGLSVILEIKCRFVLKDMVKDHMELDFW